MKSCFKARLFIILFAIIGQGSLQAQPGGSVNNKSNKIITITTANRKISLVIDYSVGCFVKQLFINGKNKLSPSGIYSGVKTENVEYSSHQSLTKVQVVENANSIILKGIKYGGPDLMVNETWRFELINNEVKWDITREYDRDKNLEDVAFPTWTFAGMDTWKGGIIDNGGMVWCKYLKDTGDTYGVHTGGVTFWNATSGNALVISASGGNGDYCAAKYSHGKNDEFSFTQLLTPNPLKQRYNLSRFVSKKTDVFAPFEVKKGIETIHLSLRYEDYFAKYSRGTLPGINADAVRELLNTTARYGVVDNNITGGNGWTTNWKCLHEPFFAQIGMAIDDPNYTRNFSATLNQERDEAILPNGRVLSRWHNVPGDEIPGTYNAHTGYYEAMWGYTIDSQTGYIINLCEQFDLAGNLKWLRTHEESAEKALNWLIKRDANHNGIFEMMNNNIAEHQASDWLDIVWASYENAFVNAQMYEALKLWSGCEKVLGKPQKAAYYTELAAKLKKAFNKPVEQGGFWSETKKQYVYWRDDDGSVHGDNLVTPVNFAAVAFGVCDDPKRIAQILDQIEQRTAAENLFHWPLCFDSFKREEVHDGNWPFPKYENGDIFPTWGYLGIRAYAGYNKSIALKYIKNLLKQYNQDGLSSQRYSRTTQTGQGDDILSGLCTSITALYRDIYGIRPKWNRMGLEPNMVNSLNGTSFNYNLRDTVYQISLSAGNYKMSTKDFSVRSSNNFGASKHGDKLTYYYQNDTRNTLQIQSASNRPIKTTIDWNNKSIAWRIKSADHYKFTFTGMQAGSVHKLTINYKTQTIKATPQGTLQLKGHYTANTKFLLE